MKNIRNYFHVPKTLNARISVVFWSFGALPPLKMIVLKSPVIFWGLGGIGSSFRSPKRTIIECSWKKWEKIQLDPRFVQYLFRSSMNRFFQSYHWIAFFNTLPTVYNTCMGQKKFSFRVPGKCARCWSTAWSRGRSSHWGRSCWSWTALGWTPPPQPGSLRSPSHFLPSSQPLWPSV